MSKPYILCVDDEKIVLDSLKTQLRRKFGDSYEIEIAESGEEALEIIQEFVENSAALHLIISDQIMPGMKGDEFLTHAYAVLPKTIKILLTGQASVEAVGNAVNNAKLYRYISKPWDETDLNLTIESALESFASQQLIEKQNEMLARNVLELEAKVAARTAELQKQKIEVEKKNSSILASLNYSKRIQTAMLPSAELLKQHLTDSFILLKPRDVVSGDFYWFEEKDNKFIICAVDCTGHGVPGAIMSMIGLEQLTEIVNLYGKTSPDEILEHLNRSVNRILKQDRNDVRDGMDMAVVTIDKSTNTIEYAGAMNPLVYVLPDDQANMQYHKVDATSLPIGGGHLERNFEKHTLRIEPNASYYLFSDGFHDQFGGPHDRKFMTKRFYELLASIQTLDMSEQKNHLETVFAEWKGEKQQIDDILIIGFRI
jgi:serine phosphatase RsbU (regulator of sigma subunit)